MNSSDRPFTRRFDPCERVVFLALAWRTDICFYKVTVAESIGFYLLGGEEYIVGRWKIVEIGGTEVAEAFGRNVKDSCCLEDSVEVVLLFEFFGSGGSFIFLSAHLLLNLLLLFGFAYYDRGHCADPSGVGRSGDTLLLFFALRARYEFAATTAGEEFAERSVAGRQNLPRRRVSVSSRG